MQLRWVTNGLLVTDQFYEAFVLKDGSRLIFTLLLRLVAQEPSFPLWLSKFSALTPAHSFVPRTVPTSFRLFRLPLKQRFVADFGRTLSECGCRKADSNENEQ
jgi:hypothetical protein